MTLDEHGARSDASARGKGRALRMALRLLGLSLLLCVLAVTFTLTLGKDLLRDWIARQASDQIGRMVRIEAFALQPLRGEIEVKGLRVAQRNGKDPQAEVERIQARIDLAALLGLKLRVLDLLIEAPRAVLHLSEDGSTDVDDLRERLTQPAQNASPTHSAPPEQSAAQAGSRSSGILSWQIERIRIESGAFKLHDGRVKQVFELDGLSLNTGGLSQQGIQDAIELQTKVQGSALQARMQISPLAPAPRLTGRINLEALALPRVAPWIPLPADLQLASGQLTLGLDVTLDTGQTEAKKLELAGKVELSNLRVGPPSSSEVGEADTTGLSLRNARIELAPSTPLGGRIDIRSIEIDALRLGSGRTAKGDLIWPAPIAKDPSPSDPNGLPALSIERIQLREGRVAWRDQLGGKTERLSLRSIDLKARNIQLPRLDQVDQLEGETELALRLDDAGDLQAQARISPAGLEAQASLHQWSMNRFLPLLMPAGGPKAQISPLDLHTQVAWQRSDDQVLIRSTRLQLAKVAVREGEQLLFAAQDLRIPRLEGRWAKGQLDLDVLDLTAREVQGPPVRPLRNLRVAAKVGGIANPAGRPLAVRATVGADEIGEASVNGSLALSPMALKGKLRLRGLDLTLLQPFLESISNIALESGRAWTDGDIELVLASPSPREPEASMPLRIRWRGDVSINELRASDPSTGDPFVRIGAMALPALQVQWSEPASSPNRIETADIALVDFFAQLTLGADGKLNLGRMMSQDTAAVGGSGESISEAPQSPKPLIRLGTLRVASGQIDFSDQFIKPNYRANLVDLRGAITPLEGVPEGPSDVEISGKVDGDTPLDINGRINLFAAEPFLDLSAVAQGFDLPKLTPYSGKWAGYAIEKGKLTAKLRYRLEGEKLQAENQVIINQLTFGDRVDSPDALKIPVQFAISLLKDVNGVIQLDLPISGTISDPQFSVGRLIWQAIGNVLTRIVTAPFTALASLASDGAPGADLSFLAFDPGSSTLDDDDARRLASLAKALTARPELSLELIGHADPASDREALSQRRFDDLVAKHRGPMTPAIEQSLRTRAAATDEDLQELARERAQNVRRILRDTHALSNERLFLVAPRLAPQEGDLPARRVSFDLK